MEYHPSSYSPEHYSLADQWKIKNQAREKGLFTPAPAGYLLRTTVAQQLHVTHATINHVIKTLGITLEQYRARHQNGQPSHKRGYHLSPRQAEQVAAYLGRSLGATVR